MENAPKSFVGDSAKSGNRANIDSKKIYADSGQKEEEEEKVVHCGARAKKSGKSAEK